MSDEDFFQRLLDSDSNNTSARWLFAQWLAERGDARAAGYCWMAGHHKRPMRVTFAWKWWTLGMAGKPSTVAEEFEKHLTADVERLSHRQYSYRTRQIAEEALCEAVNRLRRESPPEMPV